MGRQLLILACSKEKKKVPGKIPAIERYEGFFFKIAKKMMREGKFPSSVDILIISAKYGLLKPHELIENYDLKMDKRRAMELKGEILRELKEEIEKNNYDEIFVCVGKEYIMSIKGIERFARVVYAEGRIGEKGRELRRWLEKKRPSR